MAVDERIVERLAVIEKHNPNPVAQFLHVSPAPEPSVRLYLFVLEVERATHSAVAWLTSGCFCGRTVSK